MTHRNTLFTTTLLALCFLAFGCLVFPQRTLAVSPTPDGGYPGGNTAEGTNALLSLTTGTYNTAIGIYSLLSNTEGQFNTALGAGALLANVGDPSSGAGVDNTATGAGALLSNTTGESNTANGAFALFSNSTGAVNTATGADALLNNTTGFANTATGAGALFSNTVGNNNTATGFSALSANMTGDGNTATGRYALTITTGSGNTALGANAGSALTTGNFNIDIGVDVIGVAGESNTIRIGANLDDTQGASACHIGGIYNQLVDPATASSMAIDATGKLGTAVSSRRFKHDIKPMDKASEAILALKPVIFHYKSDAKNTPCFGLIAEEVAEVNPDLVVRNKNGEIWSVRYDQINAMLLNEFLKEHKKAQEQQTTIGQLKSNAAKQDATISELKSDLQIVVARLKDQGSKIQRVSAWVETHKAGPGVVRNDSRKVESNTSSQREKRKKDS
jgi:Chaperone of endosialidase